MTNYSSNANQAHSTLENSYVIPIIYEKLTPERREYIRVEAAANAEAIGLTPEQWADMRRGREISSDILMTYDPEGERLRIDRNKVGK